MNFFFLISYFKKELEAAMRLRYNLIFATLRTYNYSQITKIIIAQGKREDRNFSVFMNSMQRNFFMNSSVCFDCTRKIHLHFIHSSPPPPPTASLLFSLISFPWRIRLSSCFLFSTCSQYF